MYYIFKEDLNTINTDFNKDISDITNDLLKINKNEENNNKLLNKKMKNNNDSYKEHKPNKHLTNADVQEKINPLQKKLDMIGTNIDTDNIDTKNHIDSHHVSKSYIDDQFKTLSEQYKTVNLHVGNNDIHLSKSQVEEIIEERDEMVDSHMGNNDIHISKLKVEQMFQTSFSNVQNINSLKESVSELQVKLNNPNYVDEEEIHIIERLGCKYEESITRCCKIDMYKGSQEVIDNNYTKITVHYLGPNINDTIEFELRCMYNISDLENKEVDLIKNADSVSRVNRTDTRAQLSIRKHLPKLMLNSIMTVIVGPYIPSLEIDAIYAVPV